MANLFLVTIPLGYCRSQGYSGNDPRNLHPAFKELAELTSGQAVLLKDHWELEQLDGLTGGVLEGTNVISLGSNMSGRKKRSAGSSGDSRYSIPVDESIEKMTVTVSTTRQDTKGWYLLHTYSCSSATSILEGKENKPQKESWHKDYLWSEKQ